jgi:hypothetical protein
MRRHENSDAFSNIKMEINSNSKSREKKGEKPTAEFNIEKVPGSCRSVSIYEKLNRIGEGTYGIVCTSYLWSAWK